MAVELISLGHLGLVATTVPISPTIFVNVPASTTQTPTTLTAVEESARRNIEALLGRPYTVAEFNLGVEFGRLKYNVSREEYARALVCIFAQAPELAVTADPARYEALEKRCLGRDVDAAFEAERQAALDAAAARRRAEVEAYWARRRAAAGDGGAPEEGTPLWLWGVIGLGAVTAVTGLVLAFR
mgnify:CR=1 FL=1